MIQFAVLSTSIALLCAGFGHVHTRAIVQRDVVNPPITYPTTGTQWIVGDRHNVTWDTSVIPPNFESNGTLVLGFLDNHGGDNEHLDLDHPLANEFLITDGRAEITVPPVTTRSTYILVLFGDSGNASGKFTIKNISIGNTSLPNPSGATSSSASTASTASTQDSPTSRDRQGASPTSSGGASSTPTTYSKNWGSRPGYGTNANVFDMPTATTGSLVAQTAPVAEPTYSQYGSTGVRIAAFGGSATWISTVFSLAVALGWAL